MVALLCGVGILSQIDSGLGQTKSTNSPRGDVPRAVPNNAAIKIDPKRTPEALKSDWRPRFYNGRSYVSLQAVAAYYGFNSLDLDGNQISMALSDPPVRFDATLGQKRVKLNKLVFYFSYPVISFGGQPAMLSSFDVSNVLDPVIRPKARRDPSVLKVVVLDPAGGGIESGVRSSFGLEKDLTMDIAQRMKPLLTALGYTVMMTRDADEAVFPLERIRTANLVQDEAVYISIHAQSGGPVAKGIETSTLPPASTPATYAPETAEVDKRFFPGHINERESLALATTIQSSLVAATEADDLGIKRIPSEEMRGIQMPAVVCRVGYLSHREEGKKLFTPGYRETIAKSMVSGIQRYAKFLSADLDKRREEDARRPLSFGRPQATHLDSAAGLTGERVIIRVPIISASTEVIDRSKMEVQLFVFERVNNSDIELTIANPPKIEWLSVLPDWKTARTETFQAIYERPRLTAVETEKYGRRSYYGYVARLIYNGKLLDSASDPTNLDRCLYYFTPLFPQR